ncbi:MAG: ABC transporter permease [Acidobacteriia bacterium]|nr:ABC transporter permease [Terriglobia bacterium]
MLPALETTLQDARYAVRGLLRNPGFALAAILAAALGIGAATAVFSAVDRVLFRALPYTHEDRLVSAGMMAPLDTTEFLLAEPYIQLRHNHGPFEDLAAFQAGSIPTDLTEGEPLRLDVLRVEANFLDLFGMRPIVGRSFTREEDRPGGPRVAMISHQLWLSRFAGDPGAVGRTIPLDGAPYLIVGVLPKNFLMPTLATGDVLTPLALNEATERSGRAFRVFARMKPGVTIAQAIAQLQPQFQEALKTVPPQFRKEVTMRVRSVRDRQLGDARLASFALFGSVLAVLLIACANIASLLLARGVARERELAVRAALGASRLRLARQALTESLILSGLGAVLGWAFAWAMLRIFVSIAPAALPRLEEAALDTRVLLFTLAAALGSGLLFGIAPALRRADLAGGGRSTRRSRGGLRSALVTAEVAFCMILLTGAGLLLRSLWKLESVPLGIGTSRVVTARFVLGREHYGRNEQQLAFFNALEQKLAAAPGVESAAITDSIPPSGGMRGRPYSTIEVEGRPRLPEGTGGMVSWRYVTPDYFSAFGIPIVAGRGFAEQDRDAHAFSLILSETLARKMFPGENPLGRHILKGPEGQWNTVIGVARDVTNLGATRESWPEFYVARKPVADYNFANQEPPLGWRSAVAVARTAVDSRLAAASLRAILRQLDPALPVQIETMAQRMEQIDQRPRFYAILLASFAGIGVLIAAAGLFAVMSFLVAQRRREIGVRMALGATPARIVRMTLGSAARWTIAGVAIGAAGSLAAARLLQSMLFHVQPADPAAIAAGIVVLAIVALVASAGPARRAARLDPITTLREE